MIQSNLEKDSVIKLPNTAIYQPRSKLNITFSTADRGSAVFIFNVTKNDKPLLLSEVNVVGHIAFKHSDTSFVKTKLDFTDNSTEGQFSVNVPNELLKRQGTVTMQVYIAEKGNSNIVVAERILSFDIEQSIVSQISAETKLQYIVELDELEEQVTSRMNVLNEKMANAENYVVLIEKAREKGLSDIEIAKVTVLKAIKEIGQEQLSQIETKGKTFSDKFDEDKQEIKKEKAQFEKTIKGSGNVTKAQLESVQQHKLTKDNGYLIKISDLDFDELETIIKGTGFYYVNNAINFPEGSTKFGFLTVLYFGSEIKIYYASYDKDKVLTRTYRSKKWHPWYDPVKDMETTQGAQIKANLAEANAVKYINAKHGVLFSGSVTGVDTNILLREDISQYKMLFITLSFPGGTFTQEASSMVVSSYNIIIPRTNVVDDGSGGGHYEIILKKVDNKTLKITNDVFYDFGLNRPSGKNANKFTVRRIEGWK